MPQQENLLPTRSTEGAAAQSRRPTRIPAWLGAIELVLFVVLRLYVGVIVLLLPWRPIWYDNALLNHWPVLAAILTSGAVRGIISGLGLLNIWIAVTAVIRPRLTH
jgi:hypothetical protein